MWCVCACCLQCNVCVLWFAQEGKSALMLVCERGHISLVLSVLDGGAEVNFQQKVLKTLISTDS